MSPLIDLREHFRIWERCGNTSFWRMKDMGRGAFAFFVDPIHGKSIYAHEHPQVGGPALAVTVRDASNSSDGDLTKVYDHFQDQPWVRRVLERFFTGATLISFGLSKYKTVLDFFLKEYKDQSEHYIQTGEGYQDPGKDELLTATTKVLGSLGKESIALHKIILKDDWDDFLEGYGILEC
jgi:hypothetical protein